MTRWRRLNRTFATHPQDDTENTNTMNTHVIDMRINQSYFSVNRIFNVVQETNSYLKDYKGEEQLKRKAGIGVCFNRRLA